MTRRVFIHVGAPKTGTTYLQDRLRQNRDELASHGVHYPLGLLASHFKPALDLIDVPWGGRREDAVGQWDTLVKRVRRLEDTVIIDHEILAAATSEQIRRAMDDLEDSEVHIVYSARDLARQIPAEWQESIKHRRKWTYKRFLKKVENSPQTNSDLWFWRVQGLPDVLSRWSAGLPPERVHLVTVPQAGAPKDQLWLRFCEVFGIDPSWAPEDSLRGNPSLGIAETTVLRRLNAKLGKSDLDFVDAQSLVKELLAHRTLAHRKDMERATLPPRLYPWAEEVSERWVEWVEGSGIDVVGDLEELRPLPPPEGRKWANPDRANPTDVASAAIEALAAMTEEAARRPDPNAQLSAKVGRAARRLRGQ